MKRRGLSRYLHEKRVEQLELDLAHAHHSREVLEFRSGTESLLEYLERRIWSLESELAELILLSDEEDEEDE